MKLLRIQFVLLVVALVAAGLPASFAACDPASPSGNCCCSGGGCPMPDEAPPVTLDCACAAPAAATVVLEHGTGDVAERDSEPSGTPALAAAPRPPTVPRDRSSTPTFLLNRAILR